MERELFSYQYKVGAGDSGEDGPVLTFYHCVLLQDVGPYAAEWQIPAIQIDYDKGLLAVCDKSGNARYMCKIHIQLGEQVS